MYLTAKQLLTKLEETRVLDRLIDENPDYQLVITGHSLGAGVASVLALLLKPRNKYRNLVCYAFSPPGCVLRWVKIGTLLSNMWIGLSPVFTFLAAFLWPYTPEASPPRLSLATTWFRGKCGSSLEYADTGCELFVARVSFRSLLYLKRQIPFLLKKCQKPKAQVIFQPRWVETHVSQRLRNCCCGPYTDPHFEMKEIITDIQPRHKNGDEIASERKRSSVPDILSNLKAVKKATRKLVWVCVVIHKL